MRKFFALNGRYNLDKRKFLQLVSFASLSVFTSPTIAALLPSDPVFNRSFDDLQGNEQKFSNYLGQPILLNFWASWCAPCVREMPLLDDLHKQHPELVIIGLAVDTKANVLRFLDKTPVSYDILLAGTKGIPLMRDLGNKGGGLPFTVLFNRKGKAVDKSLGELQEPDINKRIQSII